MLGLATRRPGLLALATVVTLVAVFVPAVGAQERPPAVSQYVEMIPTPKGDHPASNAQVKRRKLTPLERRAVSTQGEGVSKTLGEVASSTAFGAPQEAQRSPSGEPNDEQGSSGGPELASAEATYSDDGPLTPFLLIGGLVVGTIAAAGAVALFRRR